MTEQPDIDAAGASGARVDGPARPADLELDPDMPAVDGYRRALEGLAATIDANWQGTIDATDADSLHDLRIAVRRSRTVLAEAKKVLPGTMRDTVRVELKRLAAATGPPRDLDVYLSEWATYTDGLPIDTVAALEPVRNLLQQRQIAAHRALADAMQDPATLALMRAWRTWLATPPQDDLGPKASAPLANVVAKRILRAHTRVVERGRPIRPDSPAEDVHDLRKDAKRLRYMLECFASVLNDGPRKKFVRRLKGLQDNLGVHQDAAVHVATLRELADELHRHGAGPETMIAIGRLIERIDQRRLAARAEFAERFAAYDTKATRRALRRALDHSS